VVALVVDAEKIERRAVVLDDGISRAQQAHSLLAE
jgi:hypothetical protein